MNKELIYEGKAKKLYKIEGKDGYFTPGIQG